MFSGHFSPKMAPNIILDDFKRYEIKRNSLFFSIQVTLSEPG